METIKWESLWELWKISVGKQERDREKKETETDHKAEVWGSVGESFNAFSVLFLQLKYYYYVG